MSSIDANCASCVSITVEWRHLLGNGGVGCMGEDQCFTDCVPQGVEKCTRSPSEDNGHALRIQEEGNRKEMICAA
jgi:hypothetical protein